MIEMDLVKWMMDFLELTQRKIGIFLILFIVSFSLYGSHVSGLWHFVAIVSCNYLFSSIIDRYVEKTMERDGKVSVQLTVLYGVVDLVIIFALLMFFR